MTLVLQGRQHKPGFYESLVGGLAQSIPQALENYQTRQETLRKENLLSQQASQKAAQEEKLKRLQLQSQERIPQLKSEEERQGAEQLYRQEFPGQEPPSGLTRQDVINLARIQANQKTSTNKLNLDNLSSQAFSKGYKAITENNLNDLYKIIDDPNVPLDIKRQLATIQSQNSTRQSVRDREFRSRQNMVQNAYNKAISSERQKIGKPGGLLSQEVKGINNRIKELENLRSKDMQRLLKDPNTYSNLAIWGNQASEFLPQENMEEMKEPDQFSEDGNIAASAPEENKQKIKFDKNNHQHVARAQQILAENGGDRNKANAKLFEEFIK